MTPLAHRIVKDVMLPVKDRTFQDGHDVLERMHGIHCFEVSNIIKMAKEIASDVIEKGIDDDLMFLPFPKTWIEWAEPNGIFHGVEFRRARSGLLIEGIAGGNIRVTCCADAEGRRPGFYEWMTFFGSEFETIFPLSGWAQVDEGSGSAASRRFINASEYKLPATIRALLALINTPRIVGRHQHMPHRGLEKALVGKKSTVGKFPLHAWTEILLKVALPKDASGEPSHEAHLTGDRAFHYVRAHLRIRMGQLELVKSHHRGNPALGVKQSRYRISA